MRHDGEGENVELRCFHILKPFPRQMKGQVPDGEIKATQSKAGAGLLT